MRALPPGLAEHLDGGVTTLCHCWRLMLNSGEVMGFTDHDRALSFDGVSYEAEAGFAATEIDSSLGLSVDNLDASGALSSSRLSEARLAGGDFDGAVVELWCVNWQDVSQRVLLKRGTVGEVTRGRGFFTAADTAALLFQTGWSGRAEMGLTGSDDFRINVSGDGAAWKSALVIDRASGAVSLPNTPQPMSPIHAQSLTTQGPGFAADTYLAGSAIAIPAGRLKPGTRYGLTFDVSKAAAGVAPPVITLRFGASGSLADAALGAMTFLPQTAAADEGLFTLDVTFRSTGATAVVQAVAGLVHTQASTGLATGAGPVRRLTSAAFDATAGNAMIGVSVNAGAAAAWTVSLVQARLENMA